MSDYHSDSDSSYDIENDSEIIFETDSERSEDSTLSDISDLIDDDEIPFKKSDCDCNICNEMNYASLAFESNQSEQLKNAILNIENNS